MALVDSASTCAQKVADFLNHNDLTTPSRQDPIYHYFVSDDPQKFRALGEEILGAKIAHVSSTMQHTG